MDKPLHLYLSRRESQIMDVLYRLGEASVADVLARMPDEPSYNTVRNILGTLAKKGYVTHRQDGKRYLYAPAVAPEQARQSAARHFVQTFFQGAPADAVLTLLGESASRLSHDDLDEIAQWIEDARQGST